jgi:predicted ATPase/DNA-binding winged helix-turn-helix (wHTH) protein
LVDSLTKEAAGTAHSALFENEDVISFGPFRLFPARRLLEKDGEPINLGGRALDILISLLGHAPEVVGNRDLLATAWPDVTVEPGSLRFHVMALRKALGDGKAGARYIINVPGRGYCFIAPFSCPKREPPSANARAIAPPLLKRMVGRDGTVQLLLALLTTHRFVTLVGAGGVGKTTVAVSAYHALAAEFDGFAHFIDLSTLSAPSLVVGAVASSLGLAVNSDDPTPNLLAYLQTQRTLLVFDNCEHLIEPVAILAETIFSIVPDLAILATSREPLRVEGEYVKRLFPLDYPAGDLDLTAAEALAFPSVQLFVERLAATGEWPALDDADAPAVGQICCKLDGVPLAIEIAASHVQAFGIKGVLALLDETLPLRWQGRRSAAPRHQTLVATLDWSYRLLPELQRLTLSRLSVFVGLFTLDAAIAVAGGGESERLKFIEAIGDLVEKSLIAVTMGDDVTRYRLLETTRAYAIAKLEEFNELEHLARQHAVYYCGLLEQLYGANRLGTPSREDIKHIIDNVRAALKWCFSQAGDNRLGTALATGAIPLFLNLSLLSECRDWSKRAIAALDGTSDDDRSEMKLQEAYGTCVNFTVGHSAESGAALERGLALAEKLGDCPRQLSLLNLLRAFSAGIGKFPDALALARRGHDIAKATGDAAALAKSHAMLAISLNFIGDQSAAQDHCEAALRPAPKSRDSSAGLDITPRDQVQAVLARVLLLRGFVDRAKVEARQAIDAASAAGNPALLCQCLISTLPVFLWAGDFAAAEPLIETLAKMTKNHDVARYRFLGLGWYGELALARGEPEEAVNLLRESLIDTSANRPGTRPSLALTALSQALAEIGEFREALETLDMLIVYHRARGDLMCLPDILRTKGDIFALPQIGNLPEAEDCFSRSIQLARRQSALLWELRAATSLSRLRLTQANPDDARTVLAPVYELFTEGFDSRYLVAAKQHLDAINRISS